MMKEDDHKDLATEVLATIGACLALLAFLFYVALAIAFIIRMETVG